MLKDQLRLDTHRTLARRTRISDTGEPDMNRPSWFAPTRAVVLLIGATLSVSCSQAPPEPAPEFTLLLSQVTSAPPSPAEAAETASAPSRLRYVAAPPGHPLRRAKQPSTWVKGIILHSYPSQTKNSALNWKFSFVVGQVASRRCQRNRCQQWT